MKITKYGIGMELVEVSEYNKIKNKGKARRRASRWWGEIRSDRGFEMKVIGGEVIVNTGNIKA